MKLIFCSLFIVLLFSCQNSVCDCVEAGEKASEISASFFDREYSVEGKDSLDQAIENRDAVCEPFKNMSAVELQEAASECENLTIRVD
jgi:hypothetical protein